MRLYIDTSDRNLLTVGLGERIFKKKASYDKSQKLILFIDELLKKEGKKVGDISEIEVNLGPGSFTGLRVGVAVAQAFSYALGVPLNGKKSNDKDGIDIKYQ